MKALLCTRPGTPGDLSVADLPNPVAGPGEAVVRVAAAALNFFDLLIIAGKYQYKPAYPFSPGAEFAGTVESVAQGVTGFAVGDRVIGYSGWGAARERLAITTERLIQMPDGLDFDRAAGLVVTYGTSYYALKDRAALKRGETLVVLGASGGVGLAAVELGKIIGARVIACASSDGKLMFAREHGADDGVNYGSRDLRDALKTLGGKHGIDVVYDPIGDRYAEPALRSLAWQGRYLVVGFAAGDIPKIPANLLLLKGSSLVGVFWGEFVRREPALNAENMGLLFSWLRERKIHPLISRRYPLSKASEALEALLARKAIGKLVVLPQQIE